jgi:pimeloyl-ACP methyl ester carboxylesterase
MDTASAASAVINAAPRFRREARMFGELRALQRSGLLQAPPTNVGDGLAVILIPGLLAPDQSLGLFARYLKRNGFSPRRAGIFSNVDCSEAEAKRLEKRLERAYQQTGRRVAIVGQSRGGVFGRALAVRRPDLVGAVIGMGSPLIDPLANVHPLLHLQLELLARLGDRKVPRLVSHKCMDTVIVQQLEEASGTSRVLKAVIGRMRLEPGDCCVHFWEDARAPFPEDVRYLSIWSRIDGVVNPRACHDPAARHLEVRSSHCGMAFNRHVYAAVLDELAQVAAEEQDRPISDSSPRRVRRRE